MKKSKKLLYATNNPAKLSEVKRYLARFDIQILSPVELGLQLDPDETGATFRENAEIKAIEFRKVVDDETIVIADDTGIEIDALGGEPGVHTRRWAGYRMTDDEIIAYTLEKMKNVRGSERAARFLTILALAAIDQPVEFFEGELSGQILEAPRIEFKSEGHPFRSLFYHPELRLLASEAQQLSREGKLDYLTHREKAFAVALPRIKELLA